MQFDNGDVIHGLDEKWTFMGGTILEWSSGLMVFLIISLFAPTPGRAMPFMLSGMVLTVFCLASIRHMFPDQERGVRNAVMTACGFAPPGIPAPSGIQPVWSAVPMSSLPTNSKFVQYGFDKIFPNEDSELVNRIDKLNCVAGK